MADQTYTGVTNAAGVCTVTIDPDRQQTWVVSQISNEMSTAPATATCAVRKNGYLITVLIPQADTAAGDPYVTVLPSDVLIVQWTGATPGAIGKVLAFYEVMTS